MTKENPALQPECTAADVKAAPLERKGAVAPLTVSATMLAESKNKKPAIKKAKLIRDSFTIPESDYALFASLKQRALGAGCEIKKSELLRAGLAVLNSLSDADLLKALALVERIKMGRPRK